MSRSELFLNLIERAKKEFRPISYRECVDELQWSAEEFLYYRELCENVMYAIATSENLPEEIQKIKYKDCTLRHIIVVESLKKLLQWLSEQTDVCFDMDSARHGCLFLKDRQYYGNRLNPYDYRYHCDEEYLEDRSLISHIHKSPDDFRAELEKMYHLFIDVQPIKCYQDGEIACSLEEAKKRSRLVDDTLSQLYSDIPEGIDDYDDTQKIEQWAKKKGDFIDKITILKENDEVLTDYIWSVENGCEFIPAAHTLYVYQDECPCHKESHNIDYRECYITNAKGERICLNINYCKDCKIFFIGYGDYVFYQKRYGNLICRVKFVSDDKHESISSRSDDSPLIHCGYNVGQDENLSSAERQSILLEIVKQHVMTRDEVVRYLQMFIRMNGARASMSYAVQKWNEDLEFALNITPFDSDVYDFICASENYIYDLTDITKPILLWQIE